MHTQHLLQVLSPRKKILVSITPYQVENNLRNTKVCRKQKCGRDLASKCLELPKSSVQMLAVVLADSPSRADRVRVGRVEVDLKPSDAVVVRTVYCI